MPYGDTQTIRKKLVGNHLRRLRKAAGLELEDVAKASGRGRTTVFRHDAGASSVSVADMEKYLRIYGVTDEKLASHLINMARLSGQMYWRREYANKVAPFQLEIADLESMAISSHVYEPVVIPGILQTEEYAHWMLRAAETVPTTPKRRSEVDPLLSLRERRRKNLFSKGAQNVEFIIGEGAFHHLVGDDDVMCRQMQYLVDTVHAGHATVKILPFTSGLPIGATFPFRLFITCDEPVDGVLYFDVPFVDVMVSERDELHHIVSAQRWLESLREAVFSQEETLRYLEKRFGASAR